MRSASAFPSLLPAEITLPLFLRIRSFLSRSLSSENITLASGESLKISVYHFLFFRRENTSRKSIDLTQPSSSSGFPSPIFQLFWLFYVLKPTSPSGMLNNLSPEKGVQEYYTRNLERQRALHPKTDGDDMSQQYTTKR